MHEIHCFRRLNVCNYFVIFKNYTDIVVLINHLLTTANKSSINDSETLMYHTNNEQNQEIIFNPTLEIIGSPKKDSSVERRRAVRARLDEIYEEKALRRLIEEEWNH